MVILIGLLLATAFAAAAIAGLFTVAQPRDSGGFRFPTPGADAAGSTPRGG